MSSKPWSRVFVIAWSIFFVGILLGISMDVIGRKVLDYPFNPILLYGPQYTAIVVAVAVLVKMLDKTLKNILMILLNIALGFVLYAAIVLMYGVETGLDSL